jgi:membrane protein
MSASIN